MPTILKRMQEWPEKMTNGPSPNAMRQYAVETDDREFDQITAEADLRAYLLSIGHDVYGNLPVSEIQFDRLDASKCFRASVSYGMRSLPENGTWDAKVDSRPESRKLFRAISAGPAYAPPGETAPDQKQMMGVNGHDVHGVEVYFPVKTYSAQVYWRSSYLAAGQPDPNYQSLQNYVDMLKTLETKVNSTYFEFYHVGALEKFEPGECLLVSSSRSWASPGLIRIDLELKSISLYQESLINLWAGGPVLISGWDDLQWPNKLGVHTASKRIVPIPIAALLNVKYGRADLNKLKVPTIP